MYALRVYCHLLAPSTGRLIVVRWVSDTPSDLGQVLDTCTDIGRLRLPTLEYTQSYLGVD